MKVLVWTAAAVLMLLCACVPDGTVKIGFDTKEYVTDKLDIKAQIPEFSGIENREFESSLNENYKNSVDIWIEEFMTATVEDVNSEFKLEQNVRYNERDFVSVVSEIYTFLGGAHGTTAWKAENIDLKQNRSVVLADLFSVDSNYKEVLGRIMLEMVEADKETYGDLWELPVLTEKQEKDFYIENGNLVIYYSPYELSYYAKGFVEFPIKLETIQSYLKEEYRRLI